ncbi:MAG TPA: hypothetical protein VLK25_00915 [Allosphingosinicella sp.]|nr:hypothetical protein [Allosphingosinicella sp.]
MSLAERRSASNAMRMHTKIKPMLVLAVLTAGCGNRPVGAAESGHGNRETAKMDQATNGTDGIRNLPSSFGKSFASLDEYLEHLRRYAGPIDQPWYREIRPGVYELVTTMRPAPPPRTFTREQLMREYGFSR